MAMQPDINNMFDLTKVMAELDPNKMMEQFANIMQEYKIPGLDSAAMLESSRKNVEALVAANRKTVQGMQAVVSRQGDMLRETANEIASTMKQLSSGDNPADVVSKQVELVKPALEKALANARELAEMVQQANTETYEIVKKRFEESMSEFKGAVKQAQQK